MSVQTFAEAFTLDELAAVELSANADLAACRALLYCQRGMVRANDERVVNTLNLLVQLGILTEDRKAEILATAQPL